MENTKKGSFHAIKRLFNNMWGDRQRNEIIKTKKYHRRWRQHRAITVDTVDIVDTVDTVETVDTIDTVDTVRHCSTLLT